MTKKLTVAILMGGRSPEHEISLISGREVLKNLDSKKYNPVPITISRAPSDNDKIQKTIEHHHCDVAFIAMHGPYGEDGTIQGLLELIGIPYTGSGVLASALGMNKIYSRKLFTQAGLIVPKYIVITKNQNVQEEKFKEFNLPYFVKPYNQGSSIGASKVNQVSELQKALASAFAVSEKVLVEEYVSGREITGSVLGNENPKPLPLVEIVPKHDFFDYEAKYNERLTDEIVPARISQALTRKAQESALLAYQTLDCRGFGRVDMIIKEDEVYVLEVNTIPGLTPVSLFPKAARAAGISYPKLLDKIITLARKT